MKSYFDYINGQGGIDGREIELTIQDDAYRPNRTKSNIEHAAALRHQLACDG